MRARQAGRRSHRSRFARWLAGSLVVLVAFNLRTAITSVSPLMDRLAAGLHLSGTEGSVLAATPVLCFGVVAPAALVLERRVGLGMSLLASMAILLIGLVVRTSGSFGVLFMGTVVACSGISLANVLGPAYIKETAGTSVGAVMGLYVSTMGLAAAGASFVSPIVASATGGWRVPLLIWAFPVVLACGVGWLALRYRLAPVGVGPSEWGGPLREGPGAGHRTSESARGRARGLVVKFRARHWICVIVMTAMQSVVYYSILAWLPTVFEDRGASAARAGGMLSVFALVGVPISLTLPALVTRVRLRWPWVALVTALSAGGIVGLAFAPLAAPLVWVVALGFGQAGVFALVLSFILLSSRTPEETVRLSLVAQMVGFLFAFIGPLLLGEIHVWVRNWRVPLGLLLLVLLPQLLGGVRASAGPRSPMALASVESLSGADP